MIASVLTEADTRVIVNLVKGLEVLQVGCYQGHDTAALALAATRVVTIGQHPGTDHTGFRDQVSMWAVIQRFYAVADHTLILPGDAAQLLYTFVPKQFDVAVLDVRALGPGAPYIAPSVLGVVAEKVIVIPERYQDWAAYAPLMAEAGFTVEQCGRVWVFDRAPVAAGEESKEGV